MRTLVTGAPGWLGTRLLEVLTDPKHPYQRFSFAQDRQVRALVLPGMSTASLPQRQNLELTEGSVTKPETLKRAMEGVDTVFHLVGIIHPKKIQDLFTLNTEGTRNMLQAAADAGVRRFVFVSSNSAGGEGKAMKEDDPPHPYMAYGRSKLEAEKIVDGFRRDRGIETVTIRPCWFYGPGNGQPPRQLRFFRMIHKGDPVLFGSGHNLRSMSYLDNTIQGLLLAEKTPAANGQTYWIADEKPYETLEVYQTIADIFGTKLKPKKLPNLVSWGCRLADRMIQATGMYQTEIHVAGEMNLDIACSVDKAKKELGYAPEIALEEGMRRSIDWARKYQGLEI